MSAFIALVSTFHMICFSSRAEKETHNVSLWLDGRVCWLVCKSLMNILCLFVSVCLSVCVTLSVYVCLFLFVCVSLSVAVCLCMFICVCLSVWLCKVNYIYLCLCLCLCLFVCVSLSVSICLCLCVFACTSAHFLCVYWCVFGGLCLFRDVICLYFKLR